MNLKRSITLTLAVGLLAGAVVIALTIAAAPSRPGRSAILANARKGPRLSSAASYTLKPSVVASQACSLEATPSLQGLDPRVAAMAPTSGFSQALDPATALSQDQAVASALSSAASVPAGAQVAIAKLPYSIAGGYIGSQNQLIAPTRCMWLITVMNAPVSTAGTSWLSNSRKPPATVPGPYTILMDVASGVTSDIVVGTGPNLVTGSGIPSSP